MFLSIIRSYEQINYLRRIPFPRILYDHLIVLFFIYLVHTVKNIYILYRVNNMNSDLTYNLFISSNTIDEIITRSVPSTHYTYYINTDRKCS